MQQGSCVLLFCLEGLGRMPQLAEHHSQVCLSRQGVIHAVIFVGNNRDNGKENGNYRDYRDHIGFI